MLKNGPETPPPKIEIQEGSAIILDVKHQDLRDKIDGAFLKKEYLESFLMQSAYFEAVLKYFLEFVHFKIIYAENENKEHKLVDILQNKVGRYSLFEVITMLRDSEEVSKSEADELNKYREKRNKVLHSLFDEMMGREEFEENLKKVVESGKVIAETKWFKSLVEGVEDLEKMYERGRLKKENMPPKQTEPQKSGEQPPSPAIN
ncbi:MAG: hypothetical protein JWL87_346 [Candidatus Adlerbacteria bacterium]|nr:hypothetical protein [Candidatus Adlerbacteria bacterium]